MSAVILTFKGYYFSMSGTLSHFATLKHCHNRRADKRCVANFPTLMCFKDLTFFYHKVSSLVLAVINIKQKILNISRKFANKNLLFPNKKNVDKNKEYNYSKVLNPTYTHLLD